MKINLLVCIDEHHCILQLFLLSIAKRVTSIILILLNWKYVILPHLLNWYALQDLALVKM